jgi:hypothetical protein
MSLIYTSVIDVHRVKTVAGTNDAIGLTGYSGAEQSPTSAQGETVLFTDIPASIQSGTTGRKKDSSLPQDAVFAPTWFIFTPANAIAKGGVRDRDIIIDDDGYRYEVAQSQWDILGYKLSCIRLEA